MKINLPDTAGGGYTCVNRTLIALKSKNGRKHEITCDTLVCPDFPNGLHRACGGGVGWSKKYFISVSSPDIAERDALLEAWIASKPELQE